MKPLIIAHDAKTTRNVEAVLAFYDEMINKKTGYTDYGKVFGA
jgi:hypothetical protein